MKKQKSKNLVFAFLATVCVAIFSLALTPTKFENSEGNSDSVVEVFVENPNNTSNGGVTIEISDTEFTSGETTSDVTFLKVGEQENYVVSNCTFDGATSSAIVVDGGTLELIDCVIEDCHNDGGNGGAIKVESGTLNFSGTSIQNSQAENGGAIFLGESAKLKMTSGEIENCLAANAGAIYFAKQSRSDISGIYENITNCGENPLIMQDQTAEVLLTKKNITVSGNATSLNGISSLAEGDSVSYTINLNDSDGADLVNIYGIAPYAEKGVLCSDLMNDGHDLMTDEVYKLCPGFFTNEGMTVSAIESVENGKNMLKLDEELGNTGVDGQVTYHTRKATLSKLTTSGGKVSKLSTSITGDVVIPRVGSDGVMVTDLASAFSDCRLITGVTIPNSVTTIGNLAFNYCVKMESVTIPEGVTSIGESAFAHNEILENITFPSSLKRLQTMAFNSCYSLISVYIPESVTTIASRVFNACIDIETMIVDEDNETYDSRDGCNAIIETSTDKLISGFKTTVIPDDVEVIGTYAFRYMPFSNINIPESVTTIGSYAFSHCDKLASIDIPESVTAIHNYAFTECFSLTEIEIPNGVKTLGDGVFANTDASHNAGSVMNLAKVTIGTGVETISSNAFYLCSAITDLTVNTNKLTISKDMFGGCANLATLTTNSNVAANGFYNSSAPLTKLEALTINNGVSSIGSSAFRGCTSLKSANISKGSELSKIAQYCFYDCTSLESFSLPDSVEVIEIWAFHNCSSLVEVEISDNSVLSSIENKAFRDCTALTEFTIPKNLACANVSDSIEPFDRCTNLSTINFAEGATLIASQKLYKLPNLVTVNIPASATEIGEGAFSHCPTLKNVNFAEGCQIESIGRIAFYGSGLESFSLPDSVTFVGSSALAFSQSLVEFNVSENSKLSEIGDRIFQGCYYMNSFSIPKTLDASTTPYYFWFESTIYTINFLPGTTSIGSLPYKKRIQTINIPESVTEIKDEAFSGFSDLKTVNIAKNSSTSPSFSIGNSAFKDCTSLKNISSLNMTNAIGASAFENCTALTSVDIWDSSIETIEASAFKNTGLTGIIIPNDVQRIESSAFYGCSALTDVQFGINVDVSLLRSIGDLAFCYTSLESVIIPSNVRTIASTAFGSCLNLKTVINLSSIRITQNTYVDGSDIQDFGRLGQYADVIFRTVCTRSAEKTFEGADGVTYTYVTYSPSSGSTMVFDTNDAELDASDGTTDGVFTHDGDFNVLISVGDNTKETYQIPDFIHGLGNNVFQSNTNLGYITIPQGVKSIGNYAFHGCYGLHVIGNLSPLTINGISHEYGYGYAMWYLGEVFNDVLIDVSSEAIDGVLYYNVVNSDSDELLGKIAYGLTADCGTNVVLQAGTTSIAYKAFEGAAFSSITLPEQVWLIQYKAFNNCTGITSLTVNTSKLTISKDMFGGCANLATLTTNSNVAENGFAGLTNLKTLTLGAEISTMGATQFSGCTGITSLTVNTNKLTISKDMFGGCANLETLTTNSNVAENGFYNSSAPLTKLATLTINNGVSSIGNSAFAECTGLTKIVYDTASTINFVAGNNVFLNAGTQGNGIAVEFGSNVSRTPDYMFCPGEYNSTSGFPKVISLDLGTNVSSVGTYTFARAANLIGTLSIPNNVKTLGWGAFYGCTGITQLGDASGLTSISGSVFYGCTGLSSVTIPNSVTSVGTSAFYGCTGLGSLVIGSGVKSIGYMAFYNNTSLTTVTFNNTGRTQALVCGYTDEGYSAMYNKSNIFSGCSNLTTVVGFEGTLMTHIGNNFFYNCSKLNSITLPSTLEYISNYSFYNCTSLKSIVFPDSLEHVGYRTFYNCSALESIDFGTGLVTLGHTIPEENYEAIDVFGQCTSLTTLKDFEKTKITEITRGLFYCCYNLTSVTIPNTVTTIGASAFANSADNNNVEATKSKLASVTIGTGVSSIASSAFTNCSAITTLTVNTNKLTITKDMFGGCANLVSLSTNSNVAASGFYNSSAPLTKLTTLTIGSSVTSIGASAFNNCTKIATLVVNTSKLTISKDMFGGCANLATLTTNSNVAASGFANLTNFTHIIVGESVTSFGEDAFSGSSSLMSVSITNLSAWVQIDFANEDANPLKKAQLLYLNGNLLNEVNGNDLSNDITIKKYAFSHYSRLSRVVITDNIYQVEQYAFSDCVALAYVTLSDDGDYRIDVDAFNGSPVYHLTIEESVESLAQSGFEGCTITTLTVNTSKLTIDKEMFGGCEDLVTLTTNSNIAASGFADLEYLTTLTIGEDVTGIHYDSSNSKYTPFDGCTAITTLKIDSTRFTISKDMFGGCGSLVTLWSDTSIVDYGFENITTLKEFYVRKSDGTTDGMMTSGSTSKYIGECAFKNCTSLADIQLYVEQSGTKTSQLLTIESWAFEKTAVTALYIPSSVTAVGEAILINCSQTVNMTVKSIRGSGWNSNFNVRLFGGLFGSASAWHNVIEY